MCESADVRTCKMWTNFAQVICRYDG